MKPRPSAIVLTLASMALASPARLVAQFAPGTWVENIAVRPCGSLLVTTLSPTAALYHVSAPSSPSPNVSLIHQFPTDIATGLLGISELPTRRDVFAFVAVANVSAAGAQSASVYTLDANVKPLAVRRVAAFPAAASVGGRSLPNGMTALPGSNAVTLVADSFAGLIWRVDVAAARIDVAAKLPEMASNEMGATAANGIKVHGDWLYFSNSWRGAVYRVPMSRDGGVTPDAVVETVGLLGGVSGLAAGAIIDDFALSQNGTIYAATGDGNALVAFSPDGKGGFSAGVIVAGGAADRTLAGGTAVAFGRSGRERDVTYVVTSGAPKQPAFFEGGKVVAFDIVSA